MPDVATSHIDYSAGGRSILKDVSLKVPKGEVMALLGQNGAGKTSLIEVLTGIVKAEKGRVSFDGEKSFNQIKSKAGILWDNLNIFPLLKVKEVIHFISSLYGLKPANFQQIYDHLELHKIEGRFMKKLSRGERKRVEILLATMHNPQLLILDEPTSELDPLIREKVWHNIFLKERTVLFTTHQWEEAKKYASTIAFIYNGEVLNTPASFKELTDSFPFTNKVITTRSIDVGIPDDTFFYNNENKKIILVPDAEHALISRIRKETVNYSVMPVELEDVYRYLIETKR